MKEVIQRSLLYGGAIAVLVGLGFAISNSKTDADVNTLLGSVDVQLRLAYGIPAVDKQGNELTSRTQMIVDAEKYSTPSIASSRTWRWRRSSRFCTHVARAIRGGRGSLRSRPAVQGLHPGTG